MLEYLQKFNNLPTNIKRKISTAEVLEAIEDLESRYNLQLANFVIRAMIKDFDFLDLMNVLEKEFKIDNIKAATLEAELRSRVFKDVLDYLSPAETSVPDDLPIKEISAEPEITIADVKRVSEVVEEAEDEEKNIARLPQVEKNNQIPLLGSNNDSPVKDFFKEDEKEISSFNSQVSSLPQKTVDLETVSEEISNSSGLIFASSELAGRLRKIILTYLKGIRTKAETREVLLKSVLSGGLSLEGAEADKVIDAAQKKKDSGLVFSSPPAKSSFAAYKEEAKPITSEKKSQPNLVEYDLAAELKKKAEASGKKIDASDISITKKQDKPASIKDAPKESSVHEVPKNKEAVRTAAALGNKKKMDDIGAPQVMSPIDELAYMDLVVFRRLGDSPSKIVEKIKNKVELLAKEGIDKQIEGIQAWRRSPVNKTYISIGQESIAEGKSIDDVIIDRKSKNLNYLTREEFEAVMDLNNKLRF